MTCPRAAALPALLACLFGIHAVPARAVIIDNDVPAGTLGHWSVDVAPGGQTTSATLTAEQLQSGGLVTTDIVFRYLSYVDPGEPGNAFTLFGDEPLPDPDDPDRVTSSGTFIGANQNPIRWEVTSSIADGSQVMVNVVRFTTDHGTLGPLRFLQYLDEDVAGPEDDVFLTRGTLAGGDLELFTIDAAEVYGISHSGALSLAGGLVNASFAGWAADRFNEIVPRITGNGQPVALDGIIANLPPIEHPVLGAVFGPEDIVSVLAWDVDPHATTATIVTTLGGVPTAAGLTCGDGIVNTEAGEACDQGEANGAPGSCCTARCQPRPAGELCRAAAHSCDVEEVCDGTSGSCPADGLRAEGEVCDDGDPETGTSACEAQMCRGVTTGVSVPDEIVVPATRSPRGVKIPVAIWIPAGGGSDKAAVTVAGTVDCADVPEELRPRQCQGLTGGLAVTSMHAVRAGSVFLRVTPRIKRNLGRTQARAVTTRLPLNKLGQRLFGKLRPGEVSRTLPVQVNSQVQDRQGRSILATFASLLERRR